MEQKISATDTKHLKRNRPCVLDAKSRHRMETVFEEIGIIFRDIDELRNLWPGSNLHVSSKENPVHRLTLNIMRFENKNSCSPRKLTMRVGSTKYLTYQRTFVFYNRTGRACEMNRFPGPTDNFSSLDDCHKKMGCHILKGKPVQSQSFIYSCDYRTFEWSLEKKIRFPCLGTPLRFKPEKCVIIIVACAVLHNVAQGLGDFHNEDDLKLKTKITKKLTKKLKKKARKLLSNDAVIGRRGDPYRKGRVLEADEIVSEVISSAKFSNSLTRFG
uniref:DDE Tnp4 domain-containing protein n=1 Tax=Romanomermis culicivorax TaxID=13658 RepID=A0A915HQY7_ROMCU